MLDKQDIESYLNRINEELSAADETGEIVLCGGAVMTAIYEAREITKDIDAAFAPAGLIRSIASKIASNDGLEADWLNDGAKGFLDPNRLTLNTVATLSNLTVKVPDAEGMLALKLSSARLRTKDEADALFLMNYLGIKDMDQVFDIMEKNIHPNMLTAKASFFAQDIFQKYQEGKQTPVPDRSLNHMREQMVKAHKELSRSPRDASPQKNIQHDER